MRKKRAESRSRYSIREQAQKRGWKLQHPSRGGYCLERQAIINHFPDMGLGLERPDFLFSINGMPALVIAAKNTTDKIDQAITEAIGYAKNIDLNSQYKIKMAVGAAGEETHGFAVEVRYLKDDERLISLQINRFSQPPILIVCICHSAPKRVGVQYIISFVFLSPR